MIVFTIPTMPQRSHYLTALLTQIAALPFPHVTYVSPHTDSRADVSNAIAGGLRAAHSTQADWLIYLEDDAYLGPACATLPALLATAPAAARMVQLMTSFDGPDGWELKAGSALSYSVALAYPPAVLEGFAAWAPSCYAAHPDWTHAPDWIQGAWLRAQRARYAIYRPSPIQHREGPSTFKGRAHRRLSPTYLRAYGPVPLLPPPPSAA
jgi:hypothetical protein